MRPLRSCLFQSLTVRRTKQLATTQWEKSPAPLAQDKMEYEEKMETVDVKQHGVVQCRIHGNTSSEHKVFLPPSLPLNHSHSRQRWKQHITRRLRTGSDLTAKSILPADTLFLPRGSFDWHNNKKTSENRFRIKSLDPSAATHKVKSELSWCSHWMKEWIISGYKIRHIEQYYPCCCCCGGDKIRWNLTLSIKTLRSRQLLCITWPPSTHTAASSHLFRPGLEAALTCASSAGVIALL